MSGHVSEGNNAFFMAKDVALSLDGENRRAFVFDFLEKEAPTA
jgi:hypothetical protein